MVVGFGLMMFGFVGFLALTFSATPAVVAGYVVAAVVPRIRSTRRILYQLGLVALLYAVLCVVTFVVLFQAMSGNAGSGILIFGHPSEDLLRPAVRSLYGIPVAVVVGELGMWLLGRRVGRLPPSS